MRLVSKDQHPQHIVFLLLVFHSVFENKSTEDYSPMPKMPFKADKRIAKRGFLTICSDIEKTRERKKDEFSRIH